MFRKYWLGCKTYVEETVNTELLGSQREKHLSWKNNNDKLILN